MRALADDDARDGDRRFMRRYVNEPPWEEPLRMLAEDMRAASLGKSGDATEIAAGRRLIELALPIDPIFAADLSWLCGAAVWGGVRAPVSARLRSWYQDPDEHHRQCALAGMLASGSHDFSDIIVPLLTSDDQQVRLRTYRAWSEFHVSSLGADWRQVVGAWKEEHRTDFIGEVVRKRRAAYIAEDLALTDPSPEVRIAAVQALHWAGAVERLCRVLAAFDDVTFEKILRDGILDRPPAELKTRALAAYRTLLKKTEDPLARIRILLVAMEAGEERAPENIIQELSHISPAGLRNHDQWSLKSILELIRKVDARRVSFWVFDRLMDGSLWGSHWTTLVCSISEEQRQRLLDAIAGQKLDPTQVHRFDGLAAAADATLSASLFSRLCVTRSDLSSLSRDDDRTNLGAILWQSERFFRAIPPSASVPGVLGSLSDDFNPDEYRVAIDIFGSVGGEDSDLRSELDDEPRQNLRAYLKAGLSHLLEQEDFSGQLKAHLAIALSRVGEPEDVDDLRKLIRSDVDRMRRGRAAWLKGDRGPLGNGGITSYSNWNVRAVSWLHSNAAAELLIELLGEPEYEEQSARALLELARIRTVASGKPSAFKPRDYAAIWAAREGRQPTEFEEERRHLYASAIRDRISAVIASSKESKDATSFNSRAKKLAVTLAKLDPRNSGDFAMEVMGLSCSWDEWARADALEALLFGGARLRPQEALSLVNPVIQYATARGSADQQQRYLLQRCLCTLAFLDEPCIGIARIKQVLTGTRFHPHELRELFVALGQSRCRDALGLLLDVARTSGTRLQGTAAEWIDAIASLGTMEAKQVLLSFADPDIPNSGVRQSFEHHELETLASRIADVARADAAVKERLYLLCARDLERGRRLLLARVIAPSRKPRCSRRGAESSERRRRSLDPLRANTKP